MESRVTEISLDECLKQLKKLIVQPFVFIDEIPAVLKEDFNSFIIGHTLSISDGRTITYDFKAYYDKVIYKSDIDYSIKWA